jgi:hypothetical protein
MSAHKHTLRKEERSPSPPKKRSTTDASAAAPAFTSRRVTGAAMDALCADEALFFSIAPKDVHGLLKLFLFDFNRPTLRAPGSLQYELYFCLPERHAWRLDVGAWNYSVCKDDGDAIVAAAKTNDKSGILITRFRVYGGEMNQAECYCFNGPFYSIARTPSGAVFGLEFPSARSPDGCIGTQEFDGCFELARSLHSLPCRLVRDFCISADDAFAYLHTGTVVMVLPLYDYRPAAEYTPTNYVIRSVAVLCNGNVAVLCHRADRGDEIHILKKDGAFVERQPLPTGGETSKIGLVDGSDNLYLIGHETIWVWSVRQRNIVCAIDINKCIRGTLALSCLITEDGRLAVLHTVTKHICLYKQVAA